jgi:hypothetical protein
VNDASGIEHDDESMIDDARRKMGFILSCTAHVKKAGLIAEINVEDEYNRA